MEQQSGLEWFIEQLEEKGDMRETPSIRNIQLNIDTSEYLELKRKAKEMDEEQTQKIVDSTIDATLIAYGFIKNK